MLRVNTTVVAVIAPPGHAPLHGIEASNVRVVSSDPEADSYQRARDAIRHAHQVNTPYLLHDADPLADVVEAWIHQYDESGKAGDLEVAVSEAVARWRSNNIDLPDYYVLVDPEGLSTTAQHWYLGFLADAAYNRVVAARSDMWLPDQLKQLRAGRWWPDMDTLLSQVDTVVPDHIGRLPSAAEGQKLVLPNSAGPEPQIKS